MTRKRRPIPEQLHEIEDCLANAREYVSQNVNVPGSSWLYLGDWLRTKPAETACEAGVGVEEHRREAHGEAVLNRLTAQKSSPDGNLQRCPLLLAHR
jgi:hypothetical protein